MKKLGDGWMRSAAFTGKELLLVIAVISVLLCLQISALTGASNQTRVAQCAANLKQYDLALQLYANDNGNILPSVSSGNWPWDVPAVVANAIMPASGLTRQNVYCPGFPQQNIDQMWNYAVNYNSNGIATSGYRTTGYAHTLANSRVLGDDLNSSVSAQQITLRGSDPSLGPSNSIYHIVASQRPLLADATISSPGQTDPTLTATYQWTLQTDEGLPSNPRWQSTPYGPWKGSSTPHMAGVVPLGGNIGMLDGHVEWRAFSNMLPRSTSTGDVFWW